MIGRAAISLECSRDVGLAGEAGWALVVVGGDGTADGALGGRLSVERLATWAQVSGDRGAAVVSVLHGVESAEVVARAGSFDIDQAFTDSHVSSIDISLLAFRAHIHIGGSAAHRVAGELIIGACEVGRAGVG